MCFIWNFLRFYWINFNRRSLELSDKFCGQQMQVIAYRWLETIWQGMVLEFNSSRVIFPLSPHNGRISKTEKYVQTSDDIGKTLYCRKCYKGRLWFWWHLLSTINKNDKNYYIILACKYDTHFIKKESPTFSFKIT